MEEAERHIWAHVCSFLTGAENWKLACTSRTMYDFLFNLQAFFPDRQYTRIECIQYEHPEALIDLNQFEDCNSLMHHYVASTEAGAKNVTPDPNQKNTIVQCWHECGKNQFMFYDFPFFPYWKHDNYFMQMQFSIRTETAMPDDFYVIFAYIQYGSGTVFGLFHMQGDHGSTRHHYIHEVLVPMPTETRTIISANIVNIVLNMAPDRKFLMYSETLQLTVT